MEDRILLLKRIPPIEGGVLDLEKFWLVCHCHVFTVFSADLRLSTVGLSSSCWALVTEHACLVRARFCQYLSDVAYCYRRSSVICLCVCLSLCRSRSWALQKRLNRSRCRLGLTRLGPRNHTLDGSRSLHGNRKFLKSSSPLKSIGSFCCGVHNKRNYSILNNSTTSDAATFRNSLTTCLTVLMLICGQWIQTRLVLVTSTLTSSVTTHASRPSRRWSVAVTIATRLSRCRLTTTSSTSSTTSTTSQVRVAYQ